MFEFPEGFGVYFIQVNQEIKIGFTGNLKKRFGAIRQGQKAEILAWLPAPKISPQNILGEVYKPSPRLSAKESEYEIHKMLNYCRLHGEWFDANAVRKWLSRQQTFKSVIESYEESRFIHYVFNVDGIDQSSWIDRNLSLDDSIFPDLTLPKSVKYWWDSPETDKYKKRLNANYLAGLEEQLNTIRQIP